MMGGELGDLLRGEDVEDLLADDLDVTGSRVDQVGEPGLGEMGVRGAGIGAVARAVDEAAVLEATHDMRQARQRGVRALGQSGHLEGVTGVLGEHGEDQILEMGEAGVPAQLLVQGAGKQLGDGHEAHPGRQFLGVQPAGAHRLSVARLLT